MSTFSPAPHDGVPVPAPQQAPMPAPLPAPQKKRSWFARHKILTTIGAIVLFFMLVNALGDDSDPGAGGAAVADGSSASTAEDAPEAEAAPEVEEQAAGIGDKIRDGKFEFTVTKVEPGTQTVGDEFLGKEAQGQFVLVHLTIENIGDEAQLFDATSQLAFDGKGNEFSTDSEAGIYLDDSNAFLNEINPGNSVDGILIFDIPVKAKLQSLELHDSFLSGGVTVAVK